MPQEPQRTPQNAEAMPEEDMPTLIETINTLKKKVGGPVSARYVQAATQAIEVISSELEESLQESLSQLTAARANATDQTFKNPLKENAIDIFKPTLDLKSMGTLCRYPLLTRVAHSLCKLLTLEDCDASVGLVDAHINTMRAILREKITSDKDKTASILAQELEARVAEVKK